MIWRARLWWRARRARGAADGIVRMKRGGHLRLLRDLSDIEEG